MPGYAIAHLHDVDVNAEIVEYLERIDSTLAPFGGRFLVHGGNQLSVEGPASAIAVVIEFPDYQAVQDWYRSPPTRPSCHCAPKMPGAQPFSPRTAVSITSRPMY